jgi:hypothetical protein
MGTVSDLMKKYGKKADDMIIEIGNAVFGPVPDHVKKARYEAARFKPEDAIKKKAKGGLIKKYGIQKKGTSPLLKKRK